MLLQKYFHIHLFFSLSGISLCVQCVVGTQSCFFFFSSMDDQLSLYCPFLTVLPWAAHWCWLPCWAMVLLGRKNPSLTFPLTTSNCFPFPWVSLDSLRFMLFSFVSPQRNRLFKILPQKCVFAGRQGEEQITADFTHWAALEWSVYIVFCYLLKH